MSKTKEKHKENDKKVNRHKRMAMGEKIELKQGGHVGKKEKEHKKK